MNPEVPYTVNMEKYNIVRENILSDTEQVQEIPEQYTIEPIEHVYITELFFESQEPLSEKELEHNTELNMIDIRGIEPKHREFIKDFFGFHSDYINANQLDLIIHNLCYFHNKVSEKYKEMNVYISRLAKDGNYEFFSQNEETGVWMWSREIDDARVFVSMNAVEWFLSNNHEILDENHIYRIWRKDNE